MDLSGRMTDAAKALFEELKKSKEEMDALGISTEKQKKLCRKSETGTTASDLSNTLFDMFKNGKTGVQDFADFFENTMKDAIFSTFKDKMLKEQMEAWYKEFDERAKDGVVDSSDQAALKKSLAEIDEKGKKWLDDMSKATGIDLSGKSEDAQGLTSNKLSRQLTEETGTELVGLFRGQYDVTKQILHVNKDGVNIMKLQLDIAMQGIRSWQAIEANTANTVQRLDLVVNRLDRVVQNTSGSSLRTTGLVP